MNRSLQAFKSRHQASINSRAMSYVLIDLWYTSDPHPDLIVLLNLDDILSILCVPFLHGYISQIHRRLNGMTATHGQTYLFLAPMTHSLGRAEYRTAWMQ